eukprot:gb/GEZN01008555.1/.p1 GENE.gb/GEZN01008555.1/~~gb/GEZN01008555.1/.p1  ORF type:complete len:256 (+),score=23.51 gb/GEZN01008555.1/:67-834(+)
MQAARSHRTHIISWLLSFPAVARGAHLPDTEGMTPLMWAARQDAAHAEDFSALSLAEPDILVFELGRGTVVGQLLKALARHNNNTQQGVLDGVRARDMEGNTALHWVFLEVLPFFTLLPPLPTTKPFLAELGLPRRKFGRRTTTQTSRPRFHAAEQFGRDRSQSLGRAHERPSVCSPARNDSDYKHTTTAFPNGDSQGCQCFLAATGSHQIRHRLATGAAGFPERVVQRCGLLRTAPCMEPGPLRDRADIAAPRR